MINGTNLPTERAFEPLKSRARKITKLADEMLAHQGWERQKENEFNQSLRSQASRYFGLVGLQIAVVVASAIFSVISLRKFFVRKHIY